MPDAIASVFRLQEEPETSRHAARAGAPADPAAAAGAGQPGAALAVRRPIVNELIDGAPELHVLATSRGPLRLRGEIEHEVPPLTAGDPTRPDEELPDAVALFVARARELVRTWR